MVWHTSLDLGLIDEVKTSDDIVVDACKDKTVLAVHYVQKKKLTDRLGKSAADAADGLLMKWVQRGQRPII